MLHPVLSRPIGTASLSSRLFWKRSLERGVNTRCKLAPARKVAYSLILRLHMLRRLKTCRTCALHDLCCYVRLYLVLEFVLGSVYRAQCNTVKI
jgi:hypothetical protein